MGEWFKLRVRGGALILMALWLLAVPFPWVVGAGIAAAVHELGHLIGLWMCGVPVMGMEIGVGGAVISTGTMEPEEELVCALAGPVAGVALCLFWRWIPEAAVCAGVQTLFNLLPLYPLDGGRVIRAVRNICCKPGEKGVQ